MMTVLQADINHMKSAIAMARRGIGRTAPNPSVGCVIVKNTIVLARAYTADGGRPHAETIALSQAGEQARRATLYVTLEPCTHHGKTPPCVDAIINAGLKRVVIGSIDPDERTSGKSIEKLKNSGIEVTYGVLEEDCKELHAGFISRITKNRPYITLKTACTIDGKIACASGESKWITCEQSRNHAHYIRSKNDAILVGIGTVLADNPMLNVRLSGVAHRGIRIVLDSKLNISLNSKLVRSANELPLLVFTNIAENDTKYESLRKSGVILHKIEPRDLNSVLDTLSNSGINNLLVEGGAAVHASFLSAGLLDELMLYRAPTVLGGNAISEFSDLEIKKLEQRHDFNLHYTLNLGVDMLELYKSKSTRN